LRTLGKMPPTLPVSAQRAPAKKGRTSPATAPWGAY
jgi:hypothetical protein